MGCNGQIGVVQYQEQKDDWNGFSLCAEVLENNWEYGEFLWGLYVVRSNFWPDCKVTPLLLAQTPTTLGEQNRVC